MLTPNRFSNLKFSLLNVTSLVIDYLLQENKTNVDSVVCHLQHYSQDFDRDDVRLAVTFLYALGKVDYSAKNDQIILKNNLANKDVANA